MKRSLSGGRGGRFWERDTERDGFSLWVLCGDEIPEIACIHLVISIRMNGST